jgi:hypothetical protein
MDKSPNAKAKYKLKILEKRDMQQGPIIHIHNGV